MSSARLPVSIAAAAAEADDASVLTGGTSKAVETSLPFDADNWSTPHSGMAEFFLFEKRSGRSKSHVWSFFHLVKGPKDGVEIGRCCRAWFVLTYLADGSIFHLTAISPADVCKGKNP